jgi:hypothetical protein
MEQIERKVISWILQTNAGSSSKPIMQRFDKYIPGEIRELDTLKFGELFKYSGKVHVCIQHYTTRSPMVTGVINRGNSTPLERIIVENDSFAVPVLERVELNTERAIIPTERLILSFLLEARA